MKGLAADKLCPVDAPMHKHRWWTHAIVGITVAIGFLTGIAGLDYGEHWDEWYCPAGLKKQVEQGRYFPQDYIYNGLYFLPGAFVLALHESSLADDMLKDVISRPTRPFAVRNWSSLAQAQADALSFLETDTFLLRVRTIYLAWTCTTPIWIYLTLLLLFPGRYWESAASAALVGFSWELATHARWIAVDGPQSALIALEIYFLAKTATGHTTFAVDKALRRAAIVAGLVLGCKLTGIFAVVPVVLAAVFLQRHWLEWHKRIWLAFSVLLVIGVTFFITTPGAFLDPFQFINQAALTSSGYEATNHANAVRNQAEHLGLFAVWMIFYTTSPYVFVAPILFLIAVLGFGRLAKDHRLQMIIWMIFACLLVGKMSQLKLLIVRNYLQLIPLIALGFGAGLITIFRCLEKKTKVVQWSVRSALILVFLANAAWLVYSARTIQTTTPEISLKNAKEYLLDQDYHVLIKPSTPRSTWRPFQSLRMFGRCLTQFRMASRDVLSRP